MATMVVVKSKRETFQNKIRRLRHSIPRADGGKGLTQQEAANLVGVSRSAWNEWECGRAKPHSQLVLRKLEQLELLVDGEI